MLRPTPICHLTIGPDSLFVIRVDSDGFHDLVAEAPKPRLCIGSKCDAWEQVPIAYDGINLGRCGLVKSSSVTTGAWQDPNKNGETP